MPRLSPHIHFFKGIAYLLITMLVAGHMPLWAEDARKDVDNPTSIGKALYEGNHPLYTTPGRVRDARDANIKLPPTQAACIACHRASGLGSFEGGVAVPPIAGHLLFAAYDTATTKRYNFPNLLRVRPAYTQEHLRTLLATGRTPDGAQVSALMPRYDFSAAEVAALSQHLNTLSAGRPPGVSDQQVLFATITTDDVSASDTQDLLNTLNAFFVTKNAGTRNEFGHRAQAERKEQVMYLRHRTWALRHWQLKGEPSTWKAQLDALWEKEPVYAVLTGLSGQSWQPVHDFCTRTATPCLLPMVDLPPQAEDFYSIYFSRGLQAQAEQAVKQLVSAEKGHKNEHKDVLLITANDAKSAQQREAITSTLKAMGLNALAKPSASNTLLATLSTLDAQATTQQLRALNVLALEQFPVILLGGATHGPLNTSAKSNIPITVSDNLPLWSASDYVGGDKARSALTRPRVWLNSRGVKVGNPLIAANAIYVATLAVESLMHVDDKFSREYCIEKLEHNLENVPTMTAYERLAIGPKQRFASKQVQLVKLSAAEQGASAAAVTADK
jgi:cytochrome c553